MSAQSGSVGASVEAIELVGDDTRPPTTTSSTFESTRNELILAPVDRGYGAWSFLVAAFLVEGIIWGLPNTYGVFLAAYLKDSSISSQKGAESLLPLIGTLSSGIIYCSGPVIYPFMARRPYLRRPMVWIGAALCWASLFGASYTHKVEALVALQGVLYAIGGVLLYAPCISYMSEWFVARRGLANGFLFAGTAVGGAVLLLTIPTLVSYLPSLSFGAVCQRGASVVLRPGAMSVPG